MGSEGLRSAANCGRPPAPNPPIDTPPCESWPRPASTVWFCYNTYCCISIRYMNFGDSFSRHFFLFLQWMNLNYKHCQVHRPISVSALSLAQCVSRQRYTLFFGSITTSKYRRRNVLLTSWHRPRSVSEHAGAAHVTSAERWQTVRR